MQGKKITWKKHILVFITTLLIFSSGFILSNYLSEKKIAQLMDLQENLRIDILSLETQFSVLAQAPCENLNESTLTRELYNISQRLASIGGTLGTENPDFLRLKKFYSILEIKHWLLLSKATKECSLNLVSIIYFYSDKKNCPDCQDQGFILTYFREKYPSLRVYSFDYDLSLSAIQTLKSVYALEKELPIVIVNDKVYYGFRDKKELEEILSQYLPLETFEEATSTESTSTQELEPSGIQP